MHARQRNVQPILPRLSQNYRRRRRTSGSTTWDIRPRGSRQKSSVCIFSSHQRRPVPRREPHNYGHTRGQEILRGRHISVGGISPRDWLHFIISLLCHDIGYVRGISQGDENGRYVCNLAGDKVGVPEGATDASLTPYHVAQSKLFVRERFSDAIIALDIPLIEKNIEHTRFPVPEDEAHKSTGDFPGLVRAADLIGQLADINYLRKQPALFNEFRETGASKNWDSKSVADLRDNYPNFCWQKVRPYIGDALRYLRTTPGRQTVVSQSLCQRFLDGA